MYTCFFFYRFVVFKKYIRCSVFFFRIDEFGGRVGVIGGGAKGRESGVFFKVIRK